MLTKEQFTHTKSPYDFLVNFLGYTRLNLTNLLINLLSLSWLNLGLFLCEGVNNEIWPVYVTLQNNFFLS